MQTLAYYLTFRIQDTGNSTIWFMHHDSIIYHSLYDITHSATTLFSANTVPETIPYLPTDSRPPSLPLHLSHPPPPPPPPPHRTHGGGGGCCVQFRLWPPGGRPVVGGQRAPAPPRPAPPARAQVNTSPVRYARGSRMCAACRVSTRGQHL